MAKIILHSTSQTLTHIPMGPVSSATYLIEDLSRSLGASDRVLASGDCTVASWTTTTTAPAGPATLNPSKISVASTAGISIGAPAVIEGPDQKRELVEIRGIASDSYVEIITSLAGSYETGSTLAGVQISVAFPDELADDPSKLDRPLRVVWSYELDGIRHVKQELIEIVRHNSGDLDVALAVRRVQTLYPDLPNRLGNHANLQDMIPLLVQEIESDLKARGIDPARFLTGQQGQILLQKKIIHHAAVLGYAPGPHEVQDGSFLNVAFAQYRAQLESLTVGLPGHGVVEADQQDQATENPSQTLRGPTLRM